MGSTRADGGRQNLQPVVGHASGVDVALQYEKLSSTSALSLSLSLPPLKHIFMTGQHMSTSCLT